MNASVEIINARERVDRAAFSERQTAHVYRCAITNVTDDQDPEAYAQVARAATDRVEALRRLRFARHDLARIERNTTEGV